MIRRPPRSTLFPSTPLFRAVRADPTSRYAYALRQPAYQARGAFTAMLDELLELLRAEAHEGATSQVVAALARVLEAREMAQGNVNPQLLTAVRSEGPAGGGGGGVRRWPKSA